MSVIGHPARQEPRHSFAALGHIHAHPSSSMRSSRVSHALYRVHPHVEDLGHVFLFEESGCESDISAMQRVFLYHDVCCLCTRA